MEKTLRIFLFFCLLFGLADALLAQKKPPPKPKPKTPTTKVVPEVGGRVILSEDVLVQIYGASILHVYTDVKNDNIMYAATPTGLYKSENKGRYWQRSFDLSEYKNLPAKDLLLSQSPSSPNVLYLATSNVGIWKSVDSGKTWADISAGVIGVESNDWVLHSLIASPADPAVVYVEFGGEIYKTLNGGRSWGHLPAPKGRPGASSYLYMGASGPDHLIFGAAGLGSFQAYESHDGGMTWEARNYPITYTDFYVNKPSKTNFVKQMWINPYASNVVYALAGSGLQVSLDSGNTWKEITFDDPDKVKAHPNYSNKTLLKAKVQDLAFVKTSKDSVYAATDGGVFFSDNRGASWTKVTSGDINSLLLDPSGDLLIVNHFGLHKFDREKGEWTPRNLGMPNMLNNSFWDAVTLCSINAEKNIIYLCDGNSWVLSDTYGLRWNWNKTPFSSSSRLKIRRMTALSDGTIFVNMSFITGYVGSSVNNTFGKVDPDGNGSILFEKEDFGVIGAVSNANPKIIYKGDSISDDGGFSWRQMNLGVDPGAYSRRVYSGNQVNSMTNIVSPVSADIAYLYLHNCKCIYATTDQGNSWKKIITPEETGDQSFLIADPKLPLGVYWSNAGAIYSSKNAGNTWERITPKNIDFGEIRQFGINPENANHVYITSSKGLWKTLDKGKSWGLIVQGLNGDDLNQIMVSSALILARGQRGIYLLTDKNLNGITDINL